MTVMCSKSCIKGRVVLGVVWDAHVNSSKNLYYKNCRFWLKTSHHTHPSYTHTPGCCPLETLLASLSRTLIIICWMCKQLAPKRSYLTSKIRSTTEAKSELQIQFCLSCVIFIQKLVWYVKFRQRGKGNIPKGILILTC